MEGRGGRERKAAAELSAVRNPQADRPGLKAGRYSAVIRSRWARRENRRVNRSGTANRGVSVRLRDE